MAARTRAAPRSPTLSARTDPSLPEIRVVASRGERAASLIAIATSPNHQVSSDEKRLLRFPRARRASSIHGFSNITRKSLPRSSSGGQRDIVLRCRKPARVTSVETITAGMP